MDYALTGAISDLLDEHVPERGINAMLHCPFHEDNTPSFSIHLEEGVWHCFSCEDSGTLNSLYRRLGKEVDTSVRLYQAKQKTEAPIIRQTNFAAKSNSQIRGLRLPEGQRFLNSFIAARGILRETTKLYGLGYDAERDALTFPYVDTEGHVTGIKYRYRNGFKASESGSSYGLYGLNRIVGKERVILCEGESDTLRVATQYSDSFAVGGTSGAAVSDSQWSRFSISLLFARRIYLLYDGDEAGDKAAGNGLRMLGDDKCVILRPPDGMDATDYLNSGGTLEEIGLECKQ